jgi:putative addiction module component (TIGR02574 family)
MARNLIKENSIMTATATSLLESILALPEADRIAIAEALLSSLPEDVVQDLDDEAFAKELQRRSDEMDKDPSACIPWSEVKKLL